MKFIAEKDGQLIDQLKEHNPSSSKNTLRSWIREGRISVDGIPAKQANMEISSGQSVALGSRKKFLPLDIEVLFDDAHIVVINKPEGLLSVATDFDQENTVHAVLKDYYHNRKVYVVHRLDQDTSGLMLFAFNEETYETLKKMFETHSIERRYCAIAEEHFDEKEGTWESYLYEDANYFVKSTDDHINGKKAITHYKVVGRSKRYTMLDLILETGRKNQIRVHASEAGHPIVGDKKYGAATNTIRRLCLHAYNLSFKHPQAGKVLSFRSPIPDKFYQLVNVKGSFPCIPTKSG